MESIEGPVDIHELNRLFAEGKLPPHTSVAVPGEQEWRSLESVLSPGSAVPPPLPEPVESSSGQPNIWESFRGWFCRLKIGGKLAVVTSGLLAMWLLFGSPDDTNENSQGISDAEGEALVRSMEARIPTTQHACPACGGKGEVANTKVRGLFNSSDDKRCETCNGGGSIRTASGYDATCPTRGGLGNQKSKTCYKCGGAGFIWGN